ncbi:MAG: adenylate/guanylate cyclase domain-containing protein [Longimicrobiales bacterium]|nr:adenylate/guanylate cyclase domain-containing protein [Longimicrobiales bacterium]
MDLARRLDPRSSFAAKVALALLGTVGLLMAVMLVVVRGETRGQIEQVTERAVLQAQRAFEESEERRREQLARRAEVFTDSRRTLALLEGAIEAGQISDRLIADLVYNLELAGFEDTTTLTILTDPDGAPVITLMGLAPAMGIDPVAIAPLTRELLARFVAELTGYQLVNGRLYTVRSVVLDLMSRVIGTAAFGLPIRDEDAEAVGRVVGAEVCFVAGGECVAGTPLSRTRLAETLAGQVGQEARTLVELDGERWELVAEPLTAEGPTEGWLAMAVPLEPVLAPFDRIRRSLAIGSVAALALALLLAVLISRGLTRPVRTLVDATRRVGRGEYDTRVPADSSDEMGQLAESFNAMTEGLALKEQYRGVLDKVVSRDVAEELLRGDVRLGGESRDATVLFADVRGFTTLTEGMEPQAVITLLNQTMERLSTIVDEEGGVVDKYIGDEIMAVFGAPLSQPDHAERAVRAAVAMQTAMEDVNRARLARSEPAVEIGVGVHTGEVVAGNMGSTNRLNYTVVGESVNLAARLCTTADPGEILVSEAVRDRLPDDVVAEPAGTREMKGFSRPVRVYAVKPGARVSRSASRAGGVILALVLGGLAAGTSAGAQSAPTLRDAGLEWISPEGTVQLGLSGRMDLEGYVPTGSKAPWIIPATNPFFAGRARLFGDLFIGSRIFVSTELRVDRGEEPRPGPWDARVDQAYVRVGPVAGLFLQAGRFVSPFAGYPQRHHTDRDPFIRPPLMYEYRTMVSAALVPANSAEFTDWKDDPTLYRPVGAPPIWGAPYQWGAMLLGRAAGVDFKAAVMNSAPSSEPDEWSWSANAMDRPSVVLGLGYTFAPGLRIDAGYNRGPYLADQPLGPFAAGWGPEDYDQVLLWGRARVEFGRTILRAEVLHDRWEVPNVAEDPVDVSFSAEVEQTLSAGLYVAGRAGVVLFNEIDASGLSYVSGASYTRDAWDYDAYRFQLAAGYRILRNLGVRTEYAVNWTAAPTDANANLLSTQLWWQY